MACGRVLQWIKAGAVPHKRFNGTKWDMNGTTNGILLGYEWDLVPPKRYVYIDIYNIYIYISQ